MAETTIDKREESETDKLRARMLERLDIADKSERIIEQNLPIIQIIVNGAKVVNDENVPIDDSIEEFEVGYSRKDNDTCRAMIGDSVFTFNYR